MKCCHINVKKANFILLSIVISRAQMASNSVEPLSKEQTANVTDDMDKSAMDLVLYCPSNYDIDCKDLNETCIKCELNPACRYGEEMSINCRKKTRNPKFQRNFTCRYCYQTEHWEHTCELKANCNSVSSPQLTYATNCTVKDDVLCLGHRTFNKNVKCNWTGGYRWTTAMALSVLLGGFGADRFYLGHWQEGIGKLFSFGGLGVWTIIDVILISLHYLGPADGSLYI
ncbi:hypothetical protein NQ318_010035 [Aromia moschata]|uniref:TM2 domain-containing protein n=1 Tax=Aromia moschata TaxID=1265417 RepID=A0AAV8Y9H6_9CUCU|nr:hypothetical protein NQ318_010035 [Aromia moschata]